MVYTGKPSRACATCKARRIKCDEERPTCSQCRKSSRHCPGYTDDFDLIFRDENKALVKRANRKASTRSTSSEELPEQASLTHSPSEVSLDSPVDTLDFSVLSRSPQPGPLSSTSSYVQPPLFIHSSYSPVPPRPAETPEDIATAYFFREFVLVPRDPDTVRGFLEFLEPVFSKAQSSSPLIDATHAVALSACGMMPGQASFLEQAGTAYSKALKKINAALKDPATQTSNETILAVLMFSLYEAIASKSNFSTHSWNKHVDGAVTLVKMRGTQQFDDPQSYNIFRAVRAIMLTNCIQRQKPVEEFPGEHGWFGTNAEENAANRLTLLSLDLPDIRRRFEALSSVVDPSYYQQEASLLLEATLRLDNRLSTWASTLPSAWQCAISDYENEVPLDPMNAPRWYGPQFTYNDVFISSILCDYRVCRIFCNTVILGCLDILTGSSNISIQAMQSEASRFVVQQMVDETCATIPFHLPADASIAGEKPPISALSLYFIIWPLLVCSRLENILEGQRYWMYGRLMFIGREFGLDADQIQSLSKQNVLTNAASFI